MNTAKPIALPANFLFYLPGSKNTDNPQADLEAHGFLTAVTCNDHFSFVSDQNGRKILKLNTLDARKELITLPLTGSETRLTLLFKAKGAALPEIGTPYGLFWVLWQNGAYQSLLRHNATNQIKGSTGQTGLNPENLVADWHDYRLVFDRAADGKAVTATAYIDGVQRHQTADFTKENGDGHFLQFGANTVSTNGLARYPYLLFIQDEDVSGKSLAELSRLVGFDLEVRPVLVNDPDPVSKKPARKPAGINLTAAVNYRDPSSIDGGTIDLKRMPFNKNAAQKVTATPELPADLAAIADAVVDPSGANGAYPTIAAAIAAVNPGALIYIKPGFYQEKLKVTKPNLSLIGESPANTVIYGYEADTGQLAGNILVEINLGESGYFTAENITFYNKGAEWNRTWDYVERRSIAFSTNNVHGGYLKNCIFLGQQDTLNLRSGRQYFEACYIEGDVDFICGGATVEFNRCHIHSLYFPEDAYIGAPAPSDTNGAGFNHGYVFSGCWFTVDAKVTTEAIFLARGAWKKGSDGGDTPAKMVVIGSQLHAKIHPDGWADWDNIATAADQFFREYQNTGPGAVAAESSGRRWLSPAEYHGTYASTAKILGFVPKMPY